MRKIIVSMMTTVDGFYAGPNGEIDWHTVDDEFNDYAAKLLDSVDTLLFGRITYDLMNAYWPTADAIKDDPVIAAKMNERSKIVFSRTLASADWNNTRIIHEIIPSEITALKHQPGKDMVIYGSGSIVTALTQYGLIDEYRIFVNPVALGKGKMLQYDTAKILKMNLVMTKTFRSGLVLLHYRTDAL